MALYNVVLKTGNVEGAGTNADVAVELRGQFGKSGWIVLDYPNYDDRERGYEDVYGFPLNIWLGDVTEIAFRLREADQDAPDWYLKYVTLVDFNIPGNAAWEFNYDGWIQIAGKKAWFDGPVLANRRYLGAAPYSTYSGPGGTSSAGLGTSSQALQAGFSTDGSRSLSVVSRSADKLDVFCAEASGPVATAAWEPAFGAWHGWWRIQAADVARFSPRAATSVVSRSADKLDVFAIGRDGTVQTAAWEPNRGGWRGWWPVGNLGAVPGAPVGAAVRAPDHLDIFAVARDGNIYTAAWEPAFGAQWHGWWRIGDVKTPPGSPVAAVSRSRDKLDAFCAGTDGRIHTAAWEPNRGGWRGWWTVGSLAVEPGTAVSATSRSADKLDVFCVGADGGVYTAAWEPAFGGSWHGWWRIGSLVASPGAPLGVASRSTDKLDVFAVGHDGYVYTAAWEPNRGGWRGWWKIGDLRAAPGSSVAAVSRSADKLDVFCVGADGLVHTAAWEPAFGAQWHGWWTIGSLQALVDPHPAVAA